MLEGRFGNTSGAPYLEGRIVLPRLGARGLISFLVDTGADASIIMPADSLKLGIDYKSLKDPTTSQGIGGLAHGFNEVGVLSFSDRRYVYSYYIQQLEISVLTAHNFRLPSLLGRDILDQWRFVMDRPSASVTFTPRRWDLRQRI